MISKDCILGFVTTARVTHATPAALYGKVANRDWECDNYTPNEWGLKDLTTQLMKKSPGNKVKVIMGGGRRSFMPNPDPDNEIEQR